MNKLNCILKFVFLCGFYCIMFAKVKCNGAKRPLGRPGRRWEENIRMDLTEIGLEEVN
jgi:hypothetical protein